MMSEKDAQVKQVKWAVGSIDHCSASTATLLGDLLNARTDNVLAGSKAGPRPRSAKPTAASAKGRAGVSSNAIGSSHDDLIQDCRPSVLSAREKAVLATEVVNATLKALTAAVKSPQKVSFQQHGQGGRRVPNRRSSADSTRPLQPCSLNRVSSSPAQPSSPKRRPSPTADGHAGLLALARCAREAFSYLRSQEPAVTVGTKNCSLQLESGMSALIGKLIALGLNELAIKELRILKRRLRDRSIEGRSDDRSMTKAETRPSRQNSGLPVENDVLASLLEFEQLAEDEQWLDLASTTQTQALKLIVSTKRFRSVETALDALLLSSHSSPVNITLKAASGSSLSPRLAQRLQVLSQLFASCSPDRTTSAERTQVYARPTISSDALFQLQTLALQTRLLWWKHTDHNGDLGKEVWDSLLRFLRAFARTSKLGPDAMYTLARTAYEDILNRISACGSIIQSDTDHQVIYHVEILKTLGILARDASQMDDAIRWTNLALDTFRTKEPSNASRCALAARLAAFNLRRASQDIALDISMPVLRQAAEALEGSIRGPSTQVDELLHDVSGLRREALSFISHHDGDAGFDQDADSTPYLEVYTICKTLIFNSLRILYRCLGPSPRTDRADDIKPGNRYESRRNTFRKTITAAIDSALSLLKTFIAASDMGWQRIDGILQDCLSLAPLLINADEEVCSKGQEKLDKVVAARVSNIYWAYSLRLQNVSDEQGQSELLQCLHRSINAGRDAVESGIDGVMLGLKLEKLANIYVAQGVIPYAKRALKESVQAQVQEGILDRVADYASKHTLHKVASQGSGIALLERTMVALLKCSWKTSHTNDTSSIIIDDSTMLETHRGCFLEWQLLLLSRMVGSNHCLEPFCSCIATTSAKLLEIYTADQFPLRRMRSLILILAMLADHESVLPPSFCRVAKAEALRTLSLDISEADKGLAAYQEHLRATIKVHLALGNPSSVSAKLQESLITWVHLVDSAKSTLALEERVTDVELLLKQLSSVTDFLAMKGLYRLSIPALNLSLKIHALRGSSDPDETVIALSKLGTQYLRLGYSGKAGFALNKAHNVIQVSGTSAEATVRWQLVNAEYLLVLGNSGKSAELLTESRNLVENDPDLRKRREPTASIRMRVEANRLLADAWNVSSRLAFESGDWSEAISHAKQCVKLNYRAWAGLENRSQKTLPKPSPVSSDSELDGLVGGLPSLKVSQTQQPVVVMSTTHGALNGPRFWPLVPSLARGLQNLSELFARLGLFQEALYYSDQAHKVFEAVDAQYYIAENLAFTGHLYLQSAQIEKASHALMQIKQTGMNSTANKAQVQLHCLQGHLHRLQGKLEDEKYQYSEAERALDVLTHTSFIRELDTLDAPSSGLETRIALLSIDHTPPKKINIPQSGRKPSSRTGKPEKEKHDNVWRQQPSSAQSECSELSGIRGNVLRCRAAVEVLQRKFEVASSLLAQAELFSTNTQSLIQQRIGLSNQLLRESLEEMSRDAVFCVVEESTISFPSVATSSRKNQRTIGDLSPGTTKLLSEKPSVEIHSRQLSKTRRPPQRSFADLLVYARDRLEEVLRMANTHCSTSTVHTLSSALSNITVLHSATLTGKPNSMRPIMPTIYSESARILAMRRERIVIEIEKEVSIRESHLRWPDPVDPNLCSKRKHDSQLDSAAFQKRYIDIIPPNWSVVSINLSEGMDELSISRLQVGQTPFILRLPLARHNSRDADEEEFGFKQARAELVEIIESANFTAHDARDMSKKGAKSKWWAEREALDTQLRDLLQNIENVWLGGFRGVFSQSPRHPELLSRFQRSFSSILDRYLPSRQKAPKRRKVEHISLAFHILGLFVDLGCPSDEVELDEHLMDLLYFVVDILQFHGEHNAYDEIDFDSIVIETKDALRCYHDTLSASNTERANSHTILILDKALHMLPWESLPCLEGLSVSRLPSLECLRERLMLRQAPKMIDNETTHVEFHIDKSNGTYVLNPSGDLKATQENFETDLKSLSGWNCIVQRDPTEVEIKNVLEKQDLFLYFGHGSGAQYIRARTIRQLDRCAVALLMGCSSGCLTEVGEFELYGTPKNYLHAGCPALVATLWDVTDKDIDRYSRHVFQRWGLFSSPTSPSSSTTASVITTDSRLSRDVNGGRRQQQQPHRSKSRKRRGDPSSPIKEVESTQSPVSLTKAVSVARKSCVLKYLNGAAPVVYGIPVHLS